MKNLKRNLKAGFILTAVSLSMFAYSAGTDKTSNGAEAQTQKEINAQLLKMAKVGNTDEISRLLKQGADVNAKNRFGDTALHRAVFFARDTETVKLLLDNNADVNVKSNDGMTPLHVLADDTYEVVANVFGTAVVTGGSEDPHQDRIDIIQLLLDNGADISARDKNGRTPIMLTKNSSVKELLRENGAIISDEISNVAEAQTQKELNTQLLQAARFGNTDEVSRLLKQGADVNAKNRSSETALHLAVFFARDTETVKLLLDNNADVNEKSNDGMTPLHMVVDDTYKDAGDLFGAFVTGIEEEDPHQNRIDIIQLLLDNGADVNARDKDGMAPIILTSNSSIKDLLIESGAETTYNFITEAQTQKELNTLLLKMAKAGNNTDEISRLLKLGADVNAKDISGETALHLAIENKETVKLLLDNGADVNVEDIFGFTALHLASSMRDVETVKLLLDSNADVNAKDKLYGFTALHLAVDTVLGMLSVWERESVNPQQELVDVTQLLLDNNADVNARDKSGRTPIMLTNDSSIKDLLKGAI